MRSCLGLWAGAALLALWAGSAAPAKASDHVTVGGANSVSDAAIFIADKNGYFRDENIDIAFTSFAGGANALPPLASGELDVYGGSPSAGFFNAVARGIKLHIVADKASSEPGYPVNRIFVRKDLVDSGRFKTLADLKGMLVAMTGPGISNQVSLDDALKRGGLKFSDVRTTDMSFPEHVAAFANKAVEASDTTEPNGTVIAERGYAVPIIGDDQLYPGHEIAVLMYSEAFTQKRHDTAMRFMRAYLKGLRYYHDALKGGHIAGPNADKVIAILAASTSIKDPAVLRKIIPNGCDPNGRVNEASQEHDLAFYRAQGLIKGEVSLKEIIDYSYADAAVKALGPYKPTPGAAR